MAIAIERIRPWYNKQLLPNQNGFRQFHGCSDAIFTIKCMQHITSRLNRPTYVLFIDLTAAYDWCVCKWLFHTVFNRIDPLDEPTLNCVRIIEELYNKTSSCMKDEDESFQTSSGDDESFQTSSGVRQGGSESLCLFNLYLDYIMRIYEHEARQ